MTPTRIAPASVRLGKLEMEFRDRIRLLLCLPRKARLCVAAKAHLRCRESGGLHRSSRIPGIPEATTGPKTGPAGRRFAAEVAFSRKKGLRFPAEFIRLWKKIIAGVDELAEV